MDTQQMIALTAAVKAAGVNVGDDVSDPKQFARAVASELERAGYQLNPKG